MSKEKVAVVLDMNEHMMNPELHDEFERNPDVQSVVVTDLDAADFVIGKVGFERKTWNDFASSMTEGRLDEQVEKLADYKHAYILIDGDMSDATSLAHTQMSGASLRGRVASLTARDDDKVRAVIPCSNLYAMADIAIRLARKHTEDPTRTYIPTGSVGIDEPAGKQMWGCLDGVGPELAERLYGHYGSPASFVMHHPMDGFKTDLLAVEGIGEERAESILNELTEK